MSIEIHRGLTRSQLLHLFFITLFWGVNWPIMKMAVTNYPPMTFRSLSAWVGVLCLWAFMRSRKISLHVARPEWGRILRLGLLNMVVWHVCLMLALPYLNSGRAAVIGYTMPVFSALWGAALYKQRVSLMHGACILAAFIGIILLLWKEFASLSGAPAAAFVLLGATATWALGTQQLRRAQTDLHILVIAFWMTVITAIVITFLAVFTESQHWGAPSLKVVGAIMYNGVIIFAYCHTAWAVLARTLSPVASSVSVSLIPVLGMLSGAYFLGETLSWHDGVAIFMIGSAVIVTLRPDKT